MNDEFDLFRAWIHALVDRKIAEAFGQDALMESVSEMHLEEELIRVIEEKKQH